MERSTMNPKKKIRPIQPHNACAVGPYRLPDVPSTLSDIQQTALPKATDIPDTINICHFCSETLAGWVQSNSVDSFYISGSICRVNMSGTSKLQNIFKIRRG